MLLSLQTELSIPCYEYSIYGPAACGLHFPTPCAVIDELKQ